MFLSLSHSFPEPQRERRGFCGRHYLEIKRERHRKKYAFFLLLLAASKCFWLPNGHMDLPHPPLGCRLSVSGSWGWRAESAISTVWGEAAIESCESCGRIVLYNCTSPITLQVTSSSIIHTTLTALCLGQQDITRGKNGFCKFQ